MKAIRSSDVEAPGRADRLEAENARLRRLLDRAGIDPDRALLRDEAGLTAVSADQGDALLGNRNFLREVLASSGDCIKVLDLDGTLTFMSEGGMRVMEVSDFNAVRGCPWPDFWEGEGNRDAKAALAAARAGGSGRFQGTAKTLLGTPKFWDVQITPIRGGDGRPAWLLAVSRDITALRQAEEDRLALTQELQHRLKNNLAMVQAIASQTFRGEVTLEAARTAFLSRLLALSRAHDVLTQESWAAAPIRRIVEGALAPYGTGQNRFRIAGPDVELAAKAALSLALSLHELATNAAKYGSLSRDGGRVAVAWSAAGGRFRLRWSEHGGPPVAPPTRAGFGTRLIERSLSGGFGAEVALRYEPDGFVCTVDAPLEGVCEG